MLEKSRPYLTFQKKRNFSHPLECAPRCMHTSFSQRNNVLLSSILLTLQWLVRLLSTQTVCCLDPGQGAPWWCSPCSLQLAGLWRSRRSLTTRCQLTHSAQSEMPATQTSGCSPRQGCWRPWNREGRSFLKSIQLINILPSLEKRPLYFLASNKGHFVIGYFKILRTTKVGKWNCARKKVFQN